MTTPLEQDIRTRVASVLVGETTLRDFYLWFTPATWEVERADGAELVRLSNHIAHLLIELTAGELTPKEAKRELALAASTYLLTETPWNEPDKAVVTTSTMNDVIDDVTPSVIRDDPRVAAHA